TTGRCRSRERARTCGPRTTPRGGGPRAHSGPGQRRGPLTTLEDLLPSLPEALPASIATCSRDGIASISYLSQVHYVDASHVALSWQFFGKTCRNLEENPRATIMVLDPITLQSHRLMARFVRSETEGPLYEGMSAQLEAMASPWGMDQRFPVRSADV